MEAIAKLDKFKHFGLPILVGASRKRFINSVSPSEPMERVGGSIAAHVDGLPERRHASSAPTTWPKPSRRSVSPPPSGTSNDRPMTDQVFVSGLALHAYHGVMQHEAKVGQTFKLDLVLDIDLTEASRSDKLADTVGYDQVVDVASEAFCAKRYRLVEAAAGAVADAVLDRFAQVTAVRVTIHKPHAPIAATFDDVGVSIFRKRRG